MPEPNFQLVETRLLDAGIAPRHATRIALELEDHYCDSYVDHLQRGAATKRAQQLAAEQLGSLEDIIVAVSNRRELRSWCYRYPAIGRAVLPLAYLLALPAASVAAGSAYMPAVARWGAIMTVSALVTAGTFLAMQLSITLG